MMNLLPRIGDFEASALNGGFPIEVGIAFKKADGRDLQESMLIRHDAWLKDGKWCDDAEKIHGITKEEIMDNGRPVGEVCEWLNDTIGFRQKLFIGDMRDKMWCSQMFHEAGRAAVFDLDYLDRWMEMMSISQKTYFEMLKKGHRAGRDAFQMLSAVQRCLNIAA